MCLASIDRNCRPSPLPLFPFTKRRKVKGREEIGVFSIEEELTSVGEVSADPVSFYFIANGNIMLELAYVIDDECCIAQLPAIT